MALMRPLPGCESKPVRHILTNMKADMPERYRKFKRTWGTYYVYDNLTGNSASLKTRDKTFGSVDPRHPMLTHPPEGQRSEHRNRLIRSRRRAIGLQHVGPDNRIRPLLDLSDAGR